MSICLAALPSLSSSWPPLDICGAVVPKELQKQKRKADGAGPAIASKHAMQFSAQFADWAKGEIEDATERLQYKSLRKICREKLNARISYLNQAMDRIKKNRA